MGAALCGIEDMGVDDAWKSGKAVFIYFCGSGTQCIWCGGMSLRGKLYPPSPLS